MNSSLDLSLTSGAHVGVDVRNRKIMGAKVIELGELNDTRNLIVDEETLDQVLMLGNAPNKGIKVRYTHPRDKEDGIGKHLGRATNFRRDNEAVYADISLASVAFSNPDGNYGQYILDFATEDPEAFGLSLSTTLDVELMLESKPEEGPVPIRFERIKAVDFVGDPAATRGGLFEESIEESALQEAEMSDNMFAELKEKDAIAPDQVEGQVEVADKKIELSEEELSSKEPDKKAEGIPNVLGENHSTFIEEFGSQGAVWFLEGKSYDECLQLSIISAKDARIAELESQLEDLEYELEQAQLGEVEAVSGSAEVQLSEEEKKKAEYEEEILSVMRKGMTAGEAELFVKGKEVFK
jgi:hypothetical protein